VLDPRTRRLVLPIVAAKVLTLLAIFACPRPLSDIFDHRQYIEVFRATTAIRRPGLRMRSIAFATWDAANYVELAEHGYGGQGPENALYPLYPLVLRVVGPLFGGDLVFAGLVVSNIAGVLALLVLHDWLLRRGPVERGRRHGALALRGARGVLREPRLRGVALLAAGHADVQLDGPRPPLGCRNLRGSVGAHASVGVFVVVPLAIALLRDRRRGPVLLSSLLPCVGWLGYLGIVALQSGDPCSVSASRTAF